MRRGARHTFPPSTKIWQATSPIAITQAPVSMFVVSGKSSTLALYAARRRPGVPTTVATTLRLSPLPSPLPPTRSPPRTAAGDRAAGPPRILEAVVLVNRRKLGVETTVVGRSNAVAT